MIIYFATGNKGKLHEVKTLASSYGIVVKQLDIKKVEIQSDSLEEISLYAVRDIYNKVISKGIDNVVVEDAGLFIEALKGFPGPYSSYVYKTIGIRGVLKLLEGVDNRKAFFKAVVVFKSSSLGERIFKGIVHGEIVEEPRGTYGFGFDPIFKPYGSDKTFAEMTVQEKNKFSHRSKAFTELFKWLKSMVSKT